MRLSLLVEKPAHHNALALVFIASALLLVLLFFDLWAGIRGTMTEAIASLPPISDVPDSLKTFPRQILFAPAFYVMVAGIMLLEVFIPAKPEQRLFSAALLQDFVWHLLQLWVFFAILGSFIQLLRALYDAYLSFLTIRVLEGWPSIWLTLLAVLVSDFVAWLHHLIRHKVRCLWFFHAVHHSQPHLNAWTDSRYHLVDYLEAELVRFLPLFMLQISTPFIVAFGFLGGWYTRLCHANIGSNFGFLRYVLVTPQSHRVHHSAEPAHQDQNFGVLLSLWDHLFRTQCRAYDVYPDTGVNEKDFPLETDWKSVLSLRPILAQQWYPFTRIWRSVKQNSVDQSALLPVTQK